MINSADLKKIIDQANKDPAFFNQLFSDPTKALAGKGVSFDPQAKIGTCGGITCAWTCSWTGMLQKEAELGAKVADCGGITCSWSCAWTGMSRESIPAMSASSKVENCSNSCSWTCSFTGGAKEDLATRKAANCWGITCGWTCSWTGFLAKK